MDIIWLSYPLLGCLVGFLAGLLGVGGGLLTIPVLLIILSFQGIEHPELYKIALATSTAAVSCTAFSSMHSHWRHQNVDFSIVKRLLPGILLGTLLGSKLVLIAPVTPLRIVFILFTFYTAYSLLSQKLPKPSRTLPNTPMMTAVGGLIGILSTLISAGGGFISVPFMIWSNISVRLAIGTSAALGFPIAISAVLFYLLSAYQTTGLPERTFAYIYWPAVIGIVITSTLFAPIGAEMAQRLNVHSLKKAFAYLLIVLGLHMLYQVGTIS